MMNSVLLRAVVLTALGAAASACGERGADAAKAPMPKVTVVTLKAQAVTLTRDLPGRTSPYLIAEVRPQVNGIVKRRRFTEGSNVATGQILYDLDDALYRAQYDSAKASLQKAEAVAQAARLTAARSTELLRIGSESVQDDESAIAALGQAEADVAAARAAVASGAVNLAYAHIEAPISGRIGKSTVTPGALVTADQSAALATIQQLDPTYVEVNQASSEWLALKQDIDAGRIKSSRSGTPAVIVLENGTTYAHEGRLQFADVSVDVGTGNFLLRAIVPNPEGVLLPGMYVRAVLNEGVLTDGLLVPQVGITRNPKGDATALVVGGDGKVEARGVTVSRTVGDQWLVEHGLSPGERVIVEGLQRVQPGMAVQAEEQANVPAAAPSTAPEAAPTAAAHP